MRYLQFHQKSVSLVEKLVLIKFMNIQNNFNKKGTVILIGEEYLETLFVFKEYVIVRVQIFISNP